MHQRLDQNDLIGIILKNRDWITADEALIRLKKGKNWAIYGYIYLYQN